MATSSAAFMTYKISEDVSKLVSGHLRCISDAVLIANSQMLLPYDTLTLLKDTSQSGASNVQTCPVYYTFVAVSSRMSSTVADSLGSSTTSLNIWHTLITLTVLSSENSIRVVLKTRGRDCVDTCSHG